MSSAQERAAPLINSDFSEHLCHNEMQARIPPREKKLYSLSAIFTHNSCLLLSDTRSESNLFQFFELQPHQSYLQQFFFPRRVRSFHIQTLTIRTPFSTPNILPVIPQIINSISDQITLVFLPAAVTDQTCMYTSEQIAALGLIYQVFIHSV